MTQSPPPPSRDINSGREASADSPVDKKERRATYRASIFSAAASFITAAIALTAVTFASPADMRARARTCVRQYSVEIASPADGAKVKNKVTITGKAEIPGDWVLLVFVQTPEELRYYVAGGVAVTVEPDGHWTIKDEPLGEGKPDDLNKIYKIYAILATREGQREFLDGLKDRNSSAPWLQSLPHHAPEDIARVTLVA